MRNDEEYKMTIAYEEFEDGSIHIETRMQNETVWLTINQMAELFGVDKSGINRH